MQKTNNCYFCSKCLVKIEEPTKKLRNSCKNKFSYKLSTHLSSKSQLLGPIG